MGLFWIPHYKIAMGDLYLGGRLAKTSKHAYHTWRVDLKLPSDEWTKHSVGFNFFGVISHHAQPKPRNRMESQFRDLGMAWQYHENQIFGDTSDISSVESMDTSLISSFFRGHVDPPASQWGAKREHSKDQSYHLEPRENSHPGVSGVTSVHIYKWDKPLNAWWLIPRLVNGL